MELSDLWDLAGRLAQRLKALGMNTPLDLRDADPRFVRGQLSVVMEQPCTSCRKRSPSTWRARKKNASVAPRDAQLGRVRPNQQHRQASSRP
jgi:hypothetical protein